MIKNGSDVSVWSRSECTSKGWMDLKHPYWRGWQSKHCWGLARIPSESASAACGRLSIPLRCTPQVQNRCESGFRAIQRAHTQLRKTKPTTATLTTDAQALSTSFNQPRLIEFTKREKNKHAIPSMINLLMMIIG